MSDYDRAMCTIVVFGGLFIFSLVVGTAIFR
jgi:hypothetical protein